MPVVSAFFGTLIKMFHDDHNPPHFHAEYGEYRAIVEIGFGKMLAGKFSKRVQQLVGEWRRSHAEDCAAHGATRKQGASPDASAPWSRRRPYETGHAVETHQAY